MSYFVDISFSTTYIAMPGRRGGGGNNAQLVLMHGRRIWAHETFTLPDVLVYCVVHVRAVCQCLLRDRGVGWRLSRIRTLARQ